MFNSPAVPSFHSASAHAGKSPFLSYCCCCCKNLEPLTATRGKAKSRCSLPLQSPNIGIRPSRHHLHSFATTFLCTLYLPAFAVAFLDWYPFPRARNHDRMMKVSVFVLSAMSLATALPIAVDTPNLDQLTAAAPCALPFRMLAQAFEPGAPRGQTGYKAGGQPANVGFSFNGGELPDNITEITDRYLFQLSIEKFEAQRNHRQPPALDWYSDGCTKVPDKPIRWNFLPACHRHDFGLQNYRQQGRLNKKTTRAIDDQFYEE